MERADALGVSLCAPDSQAAMAWPEDIMLFDPAVIQTGFAIGERTEDQYQSHASEPEAENGVLRRRFSAAYGDFGFVTMANSDDNAPKIIALCRVRRGAAELDCQTRQTVSRHIDLRYRFNTTEDAAEADFARVQRQVEALLKPMAAP